MQNVSKKILRRPTQLENTIKHKVITVREKDPSALTRIELPKNKTPY